MKITFILGGIELAGGVKLVFEYANRLQARGHEVTVVYPFIPPRSGVMPYEIKRILRGLRMTVRGLRQGASVSWFDLSARLERVPILWNRFIPKADIVVATWWATAYYVNSYRQSKGIKFHLIQHHETWGGPKQKVEQVYKLKLKKITISTWLKELLDTKFGEKVEATIPYGVYFDRFYIEKDRTYGNKRVLMAYRQSKWKGMEDGLKAWEIVKKEVPEAQLVMFGIEKGTDVPSYVEFHKFPTDDELRRIYNSCDIFLFPSHTEGLPSPPREAMACGCAVVSTNIEAAVDYTIPDKTALLSPVGDYKSLANDVISLLKDDAKLRNLAREGHSYIQNFTWEEATDRLEAVFLSALEEKSLGKPES
jgi:glycosyltransferase involved in cell wall biosynthesis